MAAQARPEGRAAQFSFRRSVIKGHGKRWKLMDAGRRDAFRRHAELLREERREENKKTVSNLSLKLRGLQDKIAENHEKTAGVSRISRCRLSMAAKTDYVECFRDNAQYTEDLVEKGTPRSVVPNRSADHCRAGNPGLDADI